MFFLFLLDKIGHCVHPKKMGPLGTRICIVVGAIVHNIVIEWQLELPSQQHVLQEL
jgi:hypothetical protein